MRDDIRVVEDLAKALDRDDFHVAARFLSEHGVYDSPGGHTRRCRQIVEVDRQSGEIVAIAHQHVDGEAERVNAFFAACGVARPRRDEA